MRVNWLQSDYCMKGGEEEEGGRRRFGGRIDSVIQTC